MQGETIGERARSITFFNRFYWPDVAATAQMLADLAEDMAAKGWTVTVVTSAGSYGGLVADLPREDWHAGVRIVRIRATRFGRDRALGRVLDSASYMLGAVLSTWRLPRQDIYVGMSDPPFIVAVALLAAKLRRAKCVYWVQDLFPQIAAALGVLDARSAAYRVFRRMATEIHGRCDLVIGLGPRMAAALARNGAPPSRTTFVHNWADAEAILPLSQDANPFVDEHGLRGKFVVLYSGNAGRAHEFDAITEAAIVLRSRRDIVFLFVGAGTRLPEIAAAAARGGLDNIRFLDYQPREKLGELLSAASVSLVTENPAVVGLLVPSKTYGILASGRPIIFVGSPASDAAQIIREMDCGMLIPPHDGAALAAAVLSLAADPERRASMGARARQAAEDRYNRHASTVKWSAAVSQMAGFP